LNRACRAALAQWTEWFATPRHVETSGPDVAVEAVTHSDLAIAYAEMGLHADALAESVKAAASDSAQCAAHGERILGALSEAGWLRLRELHSVS